MDHIKLLFQMDCLWSEVSFFSDRARPQYGLSANSGDAVLEFPPVLKPVNHRREDILEHARI